MPAEHSSRFHTTHWSLIAALPKQAGGAADSRAADALRHLCEVYWRPLYTFARHSGYSTEDAQDLTQAFLVNVVERGGLGGADPARGRFRSYLLGAMKHFMANARAQASARKRGGGHRFVPADISELEARIGGHPQAATAAEADRAFDRSWARETTERALEQLEIEWALKKKSDQFAAMRPALTGDIPDRDEAARQLGMTENALNVAIHRLRQQYAGLVRQAVAQTVADEADVEDELRYLISVLREK